MRFGDRGIIYSLQHIQPFLMFIISHRVTYCLFRITVRPHQWELFQKQVPFNLKPKKFASVSSFMTCSRFLLNVCFVIGNLSRWFVMTCWSAASLHLHLLNVSNWVYNLMQTHAIPYPFVGFVTCISRSRERNCPGYVLLGRKIILSISIYSWRYSRICV